MRPARPWAMALAAWAGLAAAADEPATPYRVISPKDDGIAATGINNRGAVVGFEWAEEPGRPGVLEQVPFYYDGKALARLPLLKGYTTTQPAAVGDNGTVVGRAGKPAPRGVRIPLRNQAFVWDARGGIRGLGALEGDWSSIAHGVSRDGRRISGISVGDGRLRACVWDKDGDAWRGRPLPQEGPVGSDVVALSGDGRLAAAVDGVRPCLWERLADGTWTRRVIGEPASLMPRAVNDAGTVVGLRHTPDGHTHAVIWSRDGGMKDLPEPAGYARSQALAINARGAVAGFVDGPTGSKVRPRAFVYESGRLTLLDQGGPNFSSATAINDRGEVAGVMEQPEP